MRFTIAGIFLTVFGLFWLVPLAAGRIAEKADLPAGGLWIVGAVGLGLLGAGQWLLWIRRWFPGWNPMMAAGGGSFVGMGVLLSMLAFTLDEGVSRWPLFLFVGLPFSIGGVIILKLARR